MIMKRIYLTIAIILFTNTIYAQWQWAKQIGGSGSDAVGIYDNGGYIFVSGRFESIDFHLDSDIFSPNGFNDMFLAKYDQNCTNRIWYKQFGGNNSSSQLESGTVGLVTSDAIYYSGAFAGTLTIDGISVTYSGGTDAFIAKFDLNGVCQWIKHAGGGNGLNGSTGGIVQDSNGNLYWSIDMDANGSLDSVSLNRGSVLVKLDNFGTILSVTNNLITGGIIRCLKLRNDELFFCGYTYNDTTIVGADTLIGYDNSDCILAKADISGNVIWSKRFGGKLPYDVAHSFDFDPSGNLFVGGSYKDTMTIDGNTIIHPPTNTDLFIALFDPNGVNSWLQALQTTGTTGLNYISYINKDASGLFYVSGSFAGSAQFGIFPVNTTNVNDMFLARYNGNGGCLGVYNFGKAIGLSVSVTSTNEVITSGVFEGTINLGTESFSSYGMRDAYIAKVDAIIGIEETGRLKNQLQIYANPNRGNFTIKVPDAVTTFKDAWLFVYDNSGKQIAKFSLDGQSDQPHFDVSENGKGIYQVKLIKGNASYSGQMVIE